LGDISESDKELNDVAQRDGSRIMSAYTVNKQHFVIVTETAKGHRATCVLLAEEALTNDLIMSEWA
jgi:hypothetical protein